MNLITQILLWAGAAISAVIFIKYYLWPYIIAKYAFWKLSQGLKKMADRQTDPETQRLLNEAAEMAKNLYRDEKL